MLNHHRRRLLAAVLTTKMFFVSWLEKIVNCGRRPKWCLPNLPKFLPTKWCVAYIIFSLLPFIIIITIITANNERRSTTGNCSSFNSFLCLLPSTLACSRFLYYYFLISFFCGFSLACKGAILLFSSLVSS